MSLVFSLTGFEYDRESMQLLRKAVLIVLLPYIIGANDFAEKNVLRADEIADDAFTEKVEYRDQVTMSSLCIASEAVICADTPTNVIRR